MSQPLFRNEVSQGRRQRFLGEILLSHPPSTTLYTLLAGLFGLAVIGFLVMVTYSHKETVSGYLEPKHGLARIVAERPGYVAAVHVQDGLEVKAGDPLFTIQSTSALEEGSDYSSIVLNELRTQKTQLEKRTHQESERLSSETTSIQKRLKNIGTEIATLSLRVDIQQQRVNLAHGAYERLKSLANDGLVSKSSLQDKQDALLNTKHELSETRQRLAAKQGEKVSIEQSLTELPLQSDERLADLRRQISELTQKNAEAQLRGRYKILAPMDGRITALSARTGQAVSTSVPLASIVPIGSPLVATLFVPTRAIGRAAPGQRVVFRYDAFPYQRYGTHYGTIDMIAKTIMAPGEVSAPIPLKEPVYVVSAALDTQAIKAYDKAINLQPGMLLSATIVFDTLSLWDWLTGALTGFNLSKA